MIKYDINDTIAAIATAIGESGIGIVRISGKEALKLADKIFLSKEGKKASDFKTYTVHYGWIRNGQNELIDEVILTVMRSPKSYTKEDIVEINCHGGIVPLRRVLELVLDNGCRIAQPGEFTKRAFLNGRIDLTQAEAVLDIIRAKTDSMLALGIEQLRGDLSRQINKIRDELLSLLSFIEANIDFPEEELGLIDLKSVSKKLEEINKRLKKLVEDSKLGRIFREGINVVICGKPNVGKSSLLNALLREERSIVTPVAGTTRDTIEELIDIRGIPVRIADTAGIIEARDLIEKKAVLRSKRFIDLADLVILMFDGNNKLNREDRVLIKKLKKKQTIAVINKIDLKQKIEREMVIKNFDCSIDISAKSSKNIELLEEAIYNLVFDGKINSPESIMVSNFRHIRAIKGCQKFIAQALNSLDNKLSLEFIAQDIKDGFYFLDDILGKVFSEDLLEKIFSDFCIGK